MSGLDVFFRVIPGTACVRHHDRENKSGRDRADQKAGKSCGSQEESNEEWSGNGHHTRGDHLFQCGIGGDGDAGVVVRLSLPLHQAGDLLELPADLLHDIPCSLPHRGHGERAEEEWQHCPDQDPDEHRRVQHIHHLEPDRLGIDGEQCKGGQGCSPDGKSFPDRCGGIPDRVKSVGDGPDPFFLVRHLGNPTRVVCHRAVGIDREGNAERGQHPDPCKGNPVESCLLCRKEDRDCDDDDRPECTLEPHGKTCDNVSRRTGLGCLYNPLGRWPVIGGVILGDEPDYEPCDQTRDRRDEYSEILGTDQGINQPIGRDHRDDETGKRPGIECLVDRAALVLRAADKERADDGRDDPEGGNQHRQQDKVDHRDIQESCCDGCHYCKAHCRNDRAYVGFIQVGAHPGDVAHVVAHVVGDDCRVPRIVLRDPGLDFPHQVCTHIGGFGEDPATDTGKESNGAGPERKSKEHVYSVGDTEGCVAVEQEEQA